ncbi:MAG: iron ABC transporter permease [Rhodoferax sp.]|nr:iron ABC transporter permease [Rhodoferax sp.]
MTLITPGRLFAIQCLLGAGLLTLGAMAGSTGLQPVSEIFSNDAALQIVWDIRLARTLGAACAGALLGLAGAIAQGLFRNPLADPYLMGSASGAALAVAVSMALWGMTPLAVHWLPRVGLTTAAFIGATLAVLLSLLLARGASHTLRLLLAGLVVGVLLGALTAMVTQLAPQVLQALQGFLLGNTALLDWTGCAVLAGAWTVCAVLAWVMSPVLDGLTLGDATARSLGLPLGRLRAGLVLVMALATGAAVAHTGLIAFVGLVAPHMVRSLVRVRHGSSVLLSSGMGAVLLMAADVLARLSLAPLELPVGVLTAVLGGGYLMWLMHRGQATAPGDAA